MKSKTIEETVRQTLAVGTGVVRMSAQRSSALFLLSWLVSYGATARAQAATAAASSRPTPWPQRTVHFLSEKPVLGLPPGSSRGKMYCSPEGEVFFSVSVEPGTTATVGKALPALYHLKDSGEVRLLARAVPPPEYTDVSALDFFAAEHTLVTLLKAEVRGDGDPNLPARETRYFVSLSDHDGDGAKLVPLDIHFEPRKVALFGSGDFLMVGWDSINLLPVMALVKDDGTVRRFLDAESSAFPVAQISHEGESMRAVRAAPNVQAAEELVDHAVFVPYGANILLSFPGSTKPIQEWSPLGQVGKIPVPLPAGFLLHDVVVTGRRRPLVFRAQAEGDFENEKKAASEKLEQRLFETYASVSSPVRELLPDKPTVQEVTCAVSSKLTAVYLDSLDGSSAAHIPSGDGEGEPKPKHLVIGTGMR